MNNKQTTAGDQRNFDEKICLLLLLLLALVAGVCCRRRVRGARTRSGGGRVGRRPWGEGEPRIFPRDDTIGSTRRAGPPTTGAGRHGSLGRIMGGWITSARGPPTAPAAGPMAGRDHQPGPGDNETAKEPLGGEAETGLILAARHSVQGPLNDKKHGHCPTAFRPEGSVHPVSCTIRATAIDSRSDLPPGPPPRSASPGHPPTQCRLFVWPAEALQLRPSRAFPLGQDALVPRCVAVESVNVSLVHRLICIVCELIFLILDTKLGEKWR